MARTGGWQGSTRHDRLPANWAAKRKRILRRQPACRLHYDCCTTTSTQVDHVVAGDDHRDANLQGVCGECHARKSAHEGTAAHRATGWLTTRRTPEPHAGVRPRIADAPGASDSHEVGGRSANSGEASTSGETDRPPTG